MRTGLVKLLIFLCLGSSFLLAHEMRDLPEEQRFYPQELITWKDFTFTYLNLYPEDSTHMYSSHPDDLKSLWDVCDNRGLLRDFFLAMVQNPRKFCVREGYSSPKTTFPPLQLSECACGNTGAYDRLFTDRRDSFENAMIQDLKQQVPQKDQTVHILSLGCGDLLQETILIGRLILEGFSSIDMTLVDFWEDDEVFENLQEFFNRTFPEITIQWTRAETISDIPPQARFQLIYAIDFDDLFAAYEKNEEWLYDGFNLIESAEPEESLQRKASFDKFDSGLGDIIQARSLLTSSGALFLGAGGLDMRISSSNNLILFHHQEACQKETSLQSAPLDYVHILTNIYHPGPVFSILVTLLDRGCESIHLTMEERDSSYKATSHLFMKKLFPLFSDKIKVELVDDIRPLIPGSHAAFLDTNYLKGDLSEYSDATHTVILN